MNLDLRTELSKPWAIEKNYFHSLLQSAKTQQAPMAVATSSGDEISHFSTMRGNVAVIHILGPVTRYESAFTRVFRSSPIEAIAREFQSVVDDPSVKAILLNIDSPGGQVNGIHEMGELIYAARGTKPIWAYSGGMAASAAYWLGTAAERFFIDATASVGSIGVVAVMMDWSKFDERAGIKEVEIVNSSSPKKRPDIKTEEGQAQIREEVNALAGIFIERVARNRQVSSETVIRNFGQGSVLVGDAAVTRGMVDGIGSFEGVIRDLKSGAASIGMTGQEAIAAVKALMHAKEAGTGSSPSAGQEPITEEED